MFEVNIGPSEPAASAAPKLDEVPTNVRSEHQLEVSLRQVLHLGWVKSQLMFEVNICSNERAAPPGTPGWMKSQLMFEVNICSSERAALLHIKLDEVPTLFEVNISVTDVQSVRAPGLE